MDASRTLPIAQTTTQCRVKETGKCLLSLWQVWRTLDASSQRSALRPVAAVGDLRPVSIRDLAEKLSHAFAAVCSEAPHKYKNLCALAAHPLSAALCGSGLVARALLRADLFLCH